MKKVRLLLTVLLLMTTTLVKAGHFTVGDKSFLLNGEPFVVKAAEIHYPRIPQPWKVDLQLFPVGMVEKAHRILPVPVSRDGKPVPVFGPHVYRYKPLVYPPTYDFKRGGLRLGVWFFVRNLLLCKFSAEIGHNKYSFMTYEIYKWNNTPEMDNYLLTHKEFIN